MVNHHRCSIVIAVIVTLSVAVERKHVTEVSWNVGTLPHSDTTFSVTPFKKGVSHSLRTSVSKSSPWNAKNKFSPILRNENKTEKHFVSPNPRNSETTYPQFVSPNPRQNETTPPWPSFVSPIPKLEQIVNLQDENIQVKTSHANCNGRLLYAKLKPGQLVKLISPGFPNWKIGHFYCRYYIYTDSDAEIKMDCDNFFMEGGHKCW